MPDKEIGFVISSENKIILYNITLLTNLDGTTIAQWKQIITALNKAGEEYIDNFTEEKYRLQRQKVEELLNYYLN